MLNFVTANNFMGVMCETVIPTLRVVLINWATERLYGRRIDGQFSYTGTQ